MGAHTAMTADDDPRRPHLYLDFCFFESCNFTCTYCRDTNAHMARGSGLDDFNTALTDFLADNTAAVLKLSGYGEATLWRELPEAVARWAPQFPVVQLITNGAGPRAAYTRLAELSNFQACVSLDSHLVDEDRLRTHGNERLHGRVLDTLLWLAARGVPVEVNCVVNRVNADSFALLLSWAAEVLAPGSIVIPFPVRPTRGRSLAEIRETLVVTDAQLDTFEQLVLHDDVVLPVLPPRRYLERLVAFMRQGSRQQPCHMHRANFGVSTSYQALPCACAGDTFIKPLGPIRSAASDPAVERRRQRFLDLGGVGAKCRTCFTHYEIANLYLAGDLAEEDVVRVPSLSTPGALAMLRRIRKELSPHAAGRAAFAWMDPETAGPMVL